MKKRNRIEPNRIEYERRSQPIQRAIRSLQAAVLTLLAFSLNPKSGHAADACEQKFKSERISCHYTQEVKAAPEIIFPLLCPVEERKWLRGWDGKVIYSESGKAEHLCVFTAKGGHLAHEGIWVISLYDPVTYRIGFLNTFANLYVDKSEIQLQRLDSNQTRLTWTRMGTSLSPEGTHVMEHYYKGFEGRTRSVIDQLEYYCQTGTMKPE